MPRRELLVIRTCISTLEGQRNSPTRLLFMVIWSATLFFVKIQLLCLKCVNSKISTTRSTINCLNRHISIVKNQSYLHLVCTFGSDIRLSSEHILTEVFKYDQLSFRFFQHRIAACLSFQAILSYFPTTRFHCSNFIV